MKDIEGCKMMKKAFVVLWVFLMVSVVSASVTINVNTLPEHKLNIFFREPDSQSNFESFYPETGDGDVTIASDTTKSKIDLKVILKKGNSVIINHVFEDLLTSEPININFIPGDVRLIKEEVVEELVDEVEEETEEIVEELADEVPGGNVVEENTETQEVEEVQDESKITGMAIGNISSKIFYWAGGIFGLVLFIGIILFFVLKKSGKSKKDEDFKVKKPVDVDDYNEKLDSAEKKIEEAKRELDELRERKKKLQDAREKFKRDQEELKRLEEEERY